MKPVNVEGGEAIGITIESQIGIHKTVRKDWEMREMENTMS